MVKSELAIKNRKNTLLSATPLIAALAMVVFVALFVDGRRPVAADHVPTPPQTQTYDVTFRSQNQNVWGPGTAASPTRSFDLISTRWNQSDGQSDIQRFAGMSFGGEIGAGTSGQLGLRAGLTGLGTGHVSIDYPVRITIDVPAVDAFRTGQTVSIGSGWTLQPGHDMKVDLPSPSVNIDGDLAIATNAYFNFCVFACVGRTDFFPPINLSWLNQPLVSTDGQTLRVLGAAVGSQGQIAPHVEAATGISGSLAAPDFPLPVSVGQDGRSLIARGSHDNFVDLQINYSRLLHDLPGGQVIGAGTPPTSSGASASYDTIHAFSGIKVSQAQEIVFAPTIRVTLQFPQAVQYTVRTPGGAIVASGNSASITYDVGNDLRIVVPPLAPGATLTATPSFSIVNSFSNIGTTVFDQSLQLDVLKLELKTPAATVIPGFCIPLLGCTPSLNAPAINIPLGPVHSESTPLTRSTNTSIMSGSQPQWQLGGFNGNVLGASFVLNPQYTPQTSVTGPSIRDEGQEGTYTFTLSDADVDPTTLTYTYNWGDGTAPVHGTGPVSGKTFTDNHTYADNGTYTVSIVVSDTHRIAGRASMQVTVLNVAPVLNHNASASIDENGTLTISGDLHDEGILDELLLTVHWGEGDTEIYSFPPSATKHQNFSVSHRYMDDNPTGTPFDDYVITMTLRDKDEAVDTRSRTVRVLNVAPTVFAGTSRTVDEGSLTSLGVDIFGKNLINNPDGEVGLDGWTVTGGLAIKPYTPMPSPIAWWTLDGTPADAIGSHRGISFIAPTTIPGKVGSAYRFGGANQAITVPSGAGLNFGTGPFSGALWLKTTDPSFLVVEKDQPGDFNSSWFISSGALPDGGGGFRGLSFTTGDGQGDATVTSSVGIADGNWHHVAWVRGNGFMQIFVDGNLTGSINVANRNVSNNERFVIGAEEVQPGQGAHDFIGDADEVMLFNRALSASEIRTLYNAFQDPMQSPTSAGPANRGTYYFGSGTSATSIGTQIVDVSANAMFMDTGQVTYDLAGHLGGIGSEGDTATLSATFRNASGATISTAQIGPVSAADRTNAIRLLQRSAVGSVPVGTRSILLTLTLTRAEGVRNDGAADNLSFALFPAPGSPLGAFFKDAGLEDTHTASVTWGDGVTETPLVAGVPGSYAADGSHRYKDNGTYVVTLTASDDDTAVTSDSFTVTVRNVAPTVTVLEQIFLVNRSETHLLASFTDPGALDWHTAVIDWGDGTPTTAGTVTETLGNVAGVLTRGTVTGTHAYSVGGPFPRTFTARITVTDKDGGVTSVPMNVTVSNIEIPNATLSASATTISENGATTFTGSFGPIVFPVGVTPFAPIYDYAWDFGDGVTTAPAAASPNTQITASHTYLNDGIYVATLKIRAFDGSRLATYALPIRSITVNNVAPVVTLNPVAPINENGTASLTGSFADPGTLDVHTILINWGDGTAQTTLRPGIGVRTFSASHQYLDNPAVGPNSYVITVTVADGDNGTGSASRSVVVSNVAPAALALSKTPASIVENGSTTLNGSFTDPGTLDAHVVTISWGDGGTTTLNLAPNVLSFSAIHKYLDNNVAGNYVIVVTVTDGDGDSVTGSTVVNVANAAPSALIVTPTPDWLVEGESTTLFGSFADPGTLDTHTVSINWGDGSTSTSINLPAGVFTFVASHAYADDNATDTYVVTVTVSDKDGGSITGASAITVINAAPSLEIGSDLTIEEGEGVALEARFDDPGVADTFAASIDWGDGAAIQTVTPAYSAGTGTFTAHHAYADNGTFTVVVTVNDDDGGADTRSFVVTVRNVAPMLVSGPDQTAPEGSVVSAGTTFVDPGTLDTHTATINWGDGTGTQTLTPTYSAGIGSIATTHVYADNGTYSVTIKVTDDDGGIGTSTFSVTVTNVAPTLVVGPDQTVAEGSAVSVSATFNDKGTRDTHVARINWGDGSSSVAGVITALPFGPPGSAAGMNGTIAFPSRVYADNGTYTVTVTVADDDGGVGTQTFVVTVTNVAPALFIRPDQTVEEGGIATAEAVFLDMGTLDTHTAVINWGDGSPSVPGVVTETPFGPPGSTAGAYGTIAASHVYADNGTYTVTVTVTDNDGGADSRTFVVTVTNVAPRLVTIPNQTASEGAVFTASATFNDGGTLDTHTATINWGDGTPTENGPVTESPTGPPGSASGANGTVAASHVYADNGTYTVTLTVTDDDGGTDTRTFLVTVTNVAPSVSAGPGRTVDVLEPLAFVAATFNDKGTLDTHTATVDWGDGSPVQSGTVSESPFGPPGSTAGVSGTASFGVHVYRYPGNYNVRLCVKDDDGAQSCDSLGVVVLGPLDFRARIILELTPFVSESKDFGDSIKDLRDSMAPGLWMDFIHLDPKDGHKVFNLDRDIVKRLSDALDKSAKEAAKGGGKNVLSAGAALAAQRAIASLVQADFVMAQTALNDAAGTAVLDPASQAKVDKELASARQSMATGDIRRAAGDWDKAVESYRKAWEHSLKALDESANGSRSLAVLAIARAQTATPGIKAKMDKVNSDLAQALSALAQGDIHRAVPDWKKAEQSYDKALQNALDALKELLKN